MNESLFQLTNMCIQLLQEVQKEVPLENLPKDWWISLGMVYNSYRNEIQNNPELKKRDLKPIPEEKTDLKNDNNS